MVCGDSFNCGGSFGYRLDLPTAKYTHAATAEDECDLSIPPCAQP